MSLKLKIYICILKRIGFLKLVTIKQTMKVVELVEGIRLFHSVIEFSIMGMKEAVGVP